MSRMTAWYVSRSGKDNSANGPYATDFVRAMLRDGTLSPMDLVFREGESEWRPAASFSEFRSSRAIDQTDQRDLPAIDGELKASANTLGMRGVSPAELGSDSNRINRPRSADDAQSWIVLRPHGGTYLQEGPFHTVEVREGLKKGTFQYGQYAWHVGMPQWMRIGDLREFDRRSVSREAAPHVPPPLPDPVEAVLLEDDGDFESEEFHVSMKLSKYDATPTDPGILYNIQNNNIQTIATKPEGSQRTVPRTHLKSAVAVGGAAERSPESLIAHDLARVPWEQDPSEHSGVFAQSVELIDDESSAPHVAHKTPPQHEAAQALVEAGAHAPVVDDTGTPFDRTPPPFVPGQIRPRSQDSWDKWGRHAAGAGLFSLALLFSWHLVTFDATASVRQGLVEKTNRAKAIADQNRAELEAAALQVETSVPPNADAASADPMASKEDPALSMSPDGAGPGLPAPPSDPQVADTTEPATATPVTGIAPNSSSNITANVKPPVVAPKVPAAIADMGIVGLKLNQPDGQIVLQGAYPAGTSIQVTFKGRLGEVLSDLSVRRTVTVKKEGAELPTLKLKDLKLPAGTYTVEVEAAGEKSRSEIFVGNRDSRFLDRMESHLRANAFEMQTQKKVLFYAAQELDVLARDLGLNYGQLRSKPELWSKFFTKWRAKVDAIGRSLEDISKRTVEEQAYPEETAQLLQVHLSLSDMAKLFEQGIGNQRDVASDSLTELIAELARQKDAIGGVTARPAETAKPTSKAL